MVLAARVAVRLNTKIEDQKHPLTMRYNDFAFTSVSTRISLQRKAESLRPLFDFVRIPSLNNFLIPILRVGAVRSKRLFTLNETASYTRQRKNVPLANPELTGDYPQPFTTLLFADCLVNVVEERKAIYDHRKAH